MAQCILRFSPRIYFTNIMKLHALFTARHLQGATVPIVVIEKQLCSGTACVTSGNNE
jgi:hypothetical protein